MARIPTARLGVELLEDRLVPANHAPTGASSTILMLEDTNYTFQTSDFGFADLLDSPANNFHAVKIVNLPGAGTLLNNGAAVNAGDFVSVADIVAGYLVFQPGADENGAAYANFGFQVQDDGGTEDGGIDLDEIARVMTLGVTAVNDAPTFTAQDPPVVTEYGDPESISGWATFHPGGGADESSQTATYLVTNVSNPDLFDQAPSVAPDGTLTYTLASYQNGESTFDVTVVDSEGAASATQTFRIRAQRVLRPFVVNITLDVPDANPGDGRALTQSGNTSLRAAIMEAYAAAGTGLYVAITFDLPANTTLSIGVNPLGAVLGALPDLHGRILIAGPGSEQLTISRNPDAGDFRIFTAGPNSSVTIQDVSITNGRATGGTPDERLGGAIANFGTMSLARVAIFGNYAADSGGAIANMSYSSLTAHESSIYANEAVNQGGAIFNRGQAEIREATSISSNTAKTGGGIYNSEGGQLVINTASQIFANAATGNGLLEGRGGGIANFGGLVTITDAYIGFNTSLNEGGGLYSEGNAWLTNVNIEQNQATNANRGKGGGIYVRSGFMILISGCRVAGNTAVVQNGGNGICLHPAGFLDALSPPNDITDAITNDPTP